MIYQNCTDHPIGLYNTKYGTITVLQPCGAVIRARIDPLPAPDLPDGIQTATFRTTRIALPPRRNNVAYIVSNQSLAAIREQWPHRDDIFAPDTTNGSAIRDETGAVIAVRRLIRNGGDRP